MSDESKANGGETPAPAAAPADKPAADPAVQATRAAPPPAAPSEKPAAAGAQPAPASPPAAPAGAQLKVLDQPGAATPPAAKLVLAEGIAPAKPPAAAPPPAKKEHEKEKTKPLKPETPTHPGAIVVEEAVEIAAPVETVWRFFLNFVKWPEWNPVCLGVKSLVQGTSFGLGWRFDLHLKCGPLKLHVQPTILENSTPQVIRWLGGKMGIHGMHWFIFEKAEAGSRVTSYEEFTGPLRWLVLAIRGWIHRMMRAWLEALKQQVEKKATGERKSPPLKPPE